MPARVTLAGVGAVAFIIGATLTGHLSAQSSAATGDAAVNALIAEVRALRAEMQAASRNQLRAQMLLGRVQMQEQRLVYLDKQRLEAVNAAAAQAQVVAGDRAQLPPPGSDPCNGVTPERERRECELNVIIRRRQLAVQETREQQLRAQEQDLTSVLQTEQVRWNDFNARLDELERSLR